jgi:hypothetical protein
MVSHDAAGRESATQRRRRKRPLAQDRAAALMAR